MITSARELLGIIPILLLIFLLAYYLQQRADSKGPLFSGKMTTKQRLLAIAISIPIACATFLLSSVFLGLIVLALVAYGLGGGGLLQLFQKGSEDDKTEYERRDRLH